MPSFAAVVSNTANFFPLTFQVKLGTFLNERSSVTIGAVIKNFAFKLALRSLTSSSKPIKGEHELLMRVETELCNN